MHLCRLQLQLSAAARQTQASGWSAQTGFWLDRAPTETAPRCGRGCKARQAASRQREDRQRHSHEADAVPMCQSGSTEAQVGQVGVPSCARCSQHCSCKGAYTCAAAIPQCIPRSCASQTQVDGSGQGAKGFHCGARRYCTRWHLLTTALSMALCVQSTGQPQSMVASVRCDCRCRVHIRAGILWHFA